MVRREVGGRELKQKKHPPRVQTEKVLTQRRKIAYLACVNTGECATDAKRFSLAEKHNDTQVGAGVAYRRFFLVLKMPLILQLLVSHGWYGANFFVKYSSKSASITSCRILVVRRSTYRGIPNCLITSSGISAKFEHSDLWKMLNLESMKVVVEARRLVPATLRLVVSSVRCGSC